MTLLPTPCPAILRYQHPAILPCWTYSMVMRVAADSVCSMEMGGAANPCKRRSRFIGCTDQAPFLSPLNTRGSDLAAAAAPAAILLKPAAKKGKIQTFPISLGKSRFGTASDRDEGSKIGIVPGNSGLLATMHARPTIVWNASISYLVPLKVSLLII